MTKEDLQLLSDLMDKKFDEKLKPIKEDISAMKSDITNLKSDVEQIKQDIDEIKYHVEVLTTTSNSMSEWIEAAAKLHLRDLHYPLKEDEKIS